MMKNYTNNPCQGWEAVTPNDTGIKCTIKELQLNKIMNNFMIITSTT